MRTPEAAGRRQDRRTRALFEKHRNDLGFGLLLKKYTANVVDATPAQKQAAVDDTIPKVGPLFWSFRIMVGLGMLFLFIFAASFFFLAIRNLAPQRWLMRLAVICIPLPWIASELGWFVAEYGRQPWTISGVLPTFLSVSSLPVSSVYASLAAFIVFYTGLFVIEMYLMLKYIRLGPSSLGTGRYFGEANARSTDGSPAARPAAQAAAFRRRIEAVAARSTAAEAASVFMALTATPVPSALVSTIACPARAPRWVQGVASSTSPVTASSPDTWAACGRCCSRGMAAGSCRRAPTARFTPGTP